MDVLGVDCHNCELGQVDATIGKIFPYLGGNAWGNISGQIDQIGYLLSLARRQVVQRFRHSQ